MKKLFFIAIIMMSMISCVSQEKYDELYYDYEQAQQECKNAKNELYSLQTNYQQLVDQYNGLVDEYDVLNSNSYYNNNKNEAIIERTKDAVSKLKKDFNWFMSGSSWCSASDIERDIRSVEEKLDGWL